LGNDEIQPDLVISVPK